MVLLAINNSQAHQDFPARRWLTQTTSPSGGPDTKLEMYLHASKAKQSRWASRAHKAYSRIWPPGRNASTVIVATYHGAAALRCAAPLQIGRHSPFGLTETPLGITWVLQILDGGATTVESNRRTSKIITAAGLGFLREGHRNACYTQHFDPISSPIWVNGGMGHERNPKLCLTLSFRGRSGSPGLPLPHCDA